MTHESQFRTCLHLALAMVCTYALLSWNSRSAHAEDSPQLKLDTSTAVPRTVEDDTQQAVTRDYARAWRDLTRAFEFSSQGLLDAYFVSTARAQLVNAVVEQTRAKLGMHYSVQS